MSETSNQILLGRILVSEGYATREQVMEAVHLQERYQINEPVGEIMVKEGFITEKQLAKALDLQARRMGVGEPRSREMKEDAVFGRIAVAKKAVTKSQLHAALREQDKRAYLGHFQQLGEVMVEMGFLTDRMIARLIEYQKKKILMCPGCYLQFNVSKYGGGHRFKCTRCGQVLTVVKNVKSAHVEADLKPEEKPATAPAPPKEEIDESDFFFPEEDRKMEKDEMVGREIGGCRLESVLGRGAMGTVYRGTQVMLGRKVAVKILSRAQTSDSYYVERFLREARAAAKITHGNIISVFNYGEEKGLYYIVMELAEGKELFNVLLEKGKLPINEALDNALKIACALEAAAAKGIIHRDIKPENIIITNRGELKVADFGIAKHMEADVSITQGRIVGTPAYMSPEQARSDKVDLRSDVYSLGATLFAMVAGRPPFVADNYLAVMRMHITAPPPVLSDFRKDLPAGLEDAVIKMLEKKPDDRFQTHDEVIRALESVRDRKGFDYTPQKTATVDDFARPKRRKVSVIMVLLLLGLLAAAALAYYEFILK